MQLHAVCQSQGHVFPRSALDMSAACLPQGLVSQDPRRLAHADESAMVAYCEQSEDDIRALIARAQTRSQSLAPAQSGSGALMRSGSTPDGGLALDGGASFKI